MGNSGACRRGAIWPGGGTREHGIDVPELVADDGPPGLSEQRGQGPPALEHPTPRLAPAAASGWAGRRRRRAAVQFSSAAPLFTASLWIELGFFARCRWRRGSRKTTAIRMDQGEPAARRPRLLAHRPVDRRAAGAARSGARQSAGRRCGARAPHGRGNATARLDLAHFAKSASRAFSNAAVNLDHVRALAGFPTAPTASAS